MPTGNKSEVNMNDMNEKFAQLFQFVSGLPATQAAINGITHDFEMLSTVVTQLQSAITSIEPLRQAVAEQGSAKYFLIKLSGMEDNLDREERFVVAKKVLIDLGEYIEAQNDFQTYGKLVREIILKFNTKEQPHDFFSDFFTTRRTCKDSPEPMHKTIAGENKRLQWREQATFEPFEYTNICFPLLGKCQKPKGFH